MGQLALSQLSESQRQHAQQTRLLHGSHFLFRRLELTRVIEVQRQIVTVELAVGQDFYRLPHLIQGLGHLSQEGQAQREIVVRRSVRRIPDDQIPEFLHA